MTTVRKPQYALLPKRMKEIINHVERMQMYELLDAGCTTEFCYILGVIADMKQTCGRVSEDYEKILRIPQTLFQLAMRG